MTFHDCYSSFDINSKKRYDLFKLLVQSPFLQFLKITLPLGREDQSVRGPPRMDSKASLMVQSTFEQAWLTWEGGQVRMT